MNRQCKRRSRRRNRGQRPPIPYEAPGQKEVSFDLYVLYFWPFSFPCNIVAGSPTFVLLCIGGCVCGWSDTFTRTPWTEPSPIIWVSFSGVWLRRVRDSLDMEWFFNHRSTLLFVSRASFPNESLPICTETPWINSPTEYYVTLWTHNE